MAPEVLLTKHESTKSVDVWAVGIILYEVLTGGKHPIFTPNDTKDTYEEKVRKL